MYVYLYAVVSHRSFSLSLLQKWAKKATALSASKFTENILQHNWCVRLTDASLFHQWEDNAFTES